MHQWFFYGSNFGGLRDTDLRFFHGSYLGGLLGIDPRFLGRDRFGLLDCTCRGYLDILGRWRHRSCTEW